MLKIFQISGHSLYPLYKDKQRVLCRKVFKHTKIKPQDTIVFKEATHGLMIKQVKHSKNAQYFVQGTDPFSQDSRDFGYITFQAIKYKVLFKF
ncbi:MAG: hypothetical protein DRQ78_07350 [Epsilonproteobacteria bacterium]|nr:MAG: hypothetical protein DRQ78_07350 [Campylobacterota bacterium]